MKTWGLQFQSYQIFSILNFHFLRSCGPQLLENSYDIFLSMPSIPSLLSPQVIIIIITSSSSSSSYGNFKSNKESQHSKATLVPAIPPVWYVKVGNPTIVYKFINSCEFQQIQGKLMETRVYHMFQFKYFKDFYCLILHVNSWESNHKNRKICGDTCVSHRM